MCTDEKAFKPDDEAQDDVIRTGVSWCCLRVTPELLDVISRARENERELQRLSDDTETVVRRLVPEGVDAAEAMDPDAALSIEELFDRCFFLKGDPLSQAPARRDMRERIRIWRHLMQGETSVPQNVEELFSLWTEAVSGEYPVYRESSKAQFRTGIPFVSRIGSPPPTEIRPGKETVAPEDIARETDALLAFMGRTDIELELHAAATEFAFLYIHPFRDGNGHTHRMLACSMLSERYSLATLLAFVGARQAARVEESLLIEDIVQEKGDVEPYARFMLEKLCEAQESLLGG